MEPEEDFVIVDLSENDKVHETLNRESVSDDEAIARELQEQIDREYDENIQRLEELRNGTSKLNISYEKYRKRENYDEFGNDSEHGYNYDDADWDRLEQIDRTINSIPRCGYVINKNGDVVTKHDIKLNGQRNMKRLMNLSLNIKTGDGVASNMGISSQALNSLREHSRNLNHHENIRRKERHKPHQKRIHRLLTFNLNGVDPYTNGIVQKMMQGDGALIKQLHGVLSEGKESIVYYGTSSKSGSRICAVKIYKPEVYKSKLHEKYLDGDPRYVNLYDPNLGQHEVISLWARKEADNLNLLRKFGIPCPRVVARKENVLIMTAVNGIDSGILMYSYRFMSSEQLINAYNTVTKYMRIMFRKAHLVHGDLSSRNIIWCRERIYLIDVSQAVDTSHEDAFNMLFQDCSKVTRMFNQAGVENLMTKQVLFKYITSQRYDREGLSRLSEKIKKRRLVVV